MKKITEEFQSHYSEISGMKKQSEDTEETLIEMLKEMMNRIKAEIEKERKDREATEENLLTLLEETCTKLNSS